MRDFYKAKSLIKRRVIVGLALLIILASNAPAVYGIDSRVTVEEILKLYPQATTNSDSTTNLLNTEVSIKVRNATFLEFFEALKKSVGKEIFLSYAAEDVKGAKPITVDIQKSSVAKVLRSVLADMGLTYDVTGNIISIKHVNSPQTKTSTQSKRFTFNGTVIDAETKKPVVGATAIVLESESGSITDEKGSFSVITEVGNTIEITFIGMKTVLYKLVNNKSDMVIIDMEVERLAVDDVVVTGYGTIDKKSFTGNAKTINGEDLLKVSRTNIFKGLQALDPSFRLMENKIFGSDPNAMPEVFIRGRSSLGKLDLDKDQFSKNNLEKNPNAPTFIMDGFEVDIQKVYDLDPNRIQSVTILKDAAATAMYGSRAANGVVVITTVPPKDGKVRVRYSLTTTLETPDLSDYNLMNAKEKLETERIAGLFDDEKGYDNYNKYLRKYNTVYIEGVETDWMSLPLRNAFKHNHSLGVEGGTSGFRWGLDFNFKDDNGVMKGSYRDVAGIELSLAYNKKKINIQNIVSYNSNWSEDSPYGAFSDFSHQLPYNRYADSNGNTLKTLEYTDGIPVPNPMYEATLNNFTKDMYEQFTNNLQLRWYVTNDLMVTGQFGISKRWIDNEKFIDPKSLKSSQKLSSSNLLSGDLYTNIGKSTRLNGKFTVSYNKMAGLNNLNISVNGELNQDSNEYTKTHYRGFPSGKLSSVNYASEVNGKPKKTEGTSRTAAFRGVLNYSYNNIYLADASFCLEGSSMFGTENKTAGYFSGGVGINVHNYKFMESLKGTVDRLKLRASYGQTGNVNFESYTAANHFTAMFDDWYITGYGTKITYLGNPNLKGELTHTFDVGFDLSLFKGRLDVKGSYYNKITNDMINDVTIPTSSGFKVYKDNLGKSRNRGYELEVFATVVRKHDFNLSVNANFSRNKNVMLEIAESLKDYNSRVKEYYYKDGNLLDRDKNSSNIFTMYEEGRSMTAKFGMKSLGIDPATGKEAFLDRFSEMTYEWSGTDLVQIGDEEPKGIGSFGLSSRYKNFTLTATFSYEFGGDVYNSTLVNYVENAKIETQNVDKRVLTQRWQKVGDIAPLKDIKDQSLTTLPTSRFMQRYNMLSMGSISLQYEFGSAITKALRVERLRLEASSSEVFRLSSIKEERGLSYPFARSYNLSLMLNF